MNTNLDDRDLFIISSLKNDLARFSNAYPPPYPIELFVRMIVLDTTPDILTFMFINSNVNINDKYKGKYMIEYTSNPTIIQFLLDRGSVVQNYRELNRQLKINNIINKTLFEYLNRYRIGEEERILIARERYVNIPYDLQYTIAKYNMDVHNERNQFWIRIHGKLEGPYKNINENGYKTKGQYILGNKEGKWVVKDRNNQIISIINFRRDTKNGYYKNISRDSDTVEEGYYQNGLKNGEWITKGLSDGEPLIEENFIDDNLDGLYKAYFDNHHIALLAEYYYGQKVGEYKEWYENGTQKIDAYYEEDRLNGPYREYDEQGELILYGHYEYGRRNGIWRIYLPDRSAYEEGEMLNGERVGDWHIVNL